MTLIVKVLVRSKYPNLPTRGFYTRETRNSAGERVGFEAVTVDGHVASLASISPIPLASSSATREGKAVAPRVGKYYVDVGEFEGLASPELAVTNVEEADSGSSRLFVIDEAGKMELFVPSFFPAVWEILHFCNFFAELRSSQAPLNLQIKDQKSSRCGSLLSHKEQS